MELNDFLHQINELQSKAKFLDYLVLKFYDPVSGNIVIPTTNNNKSNLLGITGRRSNLPKEFSRDQIRRLYQMEEFYSRFDIETLKTHLFKD